MMSIRNLSLRQILRIDAAITGATALLMLAGAPLLDGLLDLPTVLLAAAGAVLVPYVAYLLWLASRDPVPRAGIRAAIAANVAWAVGCAVLLLGGWVEPNALGVAFILLNAIVVFVFADLQMLAMRGEQPKRARNAYSLEV